MSEPSEPIRVLIIEDSKTQALYLKMMLEDFDMQTQCANTFASGVECVDRQRFDAVMLDLSLPDKSGIDTLLSLVNHAPSLPVIVLTASDEQALGMEALKNGADDFLVKGDTSPAALVRAIRYAIERKKQALTLRQLQRHTQEVIEHARDAFVAAGLDGRIVDWNMKAEQLFGWSRTEALGKPLAELILVENDRSILLDGISSFARDFDGPLVMDKLELTGRNKSDHQFTLEMAFFPVRTGETFSLCSFVSDITNRKKVEQRMNQFYATVSHELRSPISSIHGGLKLLGSGVLGELSDEAKETIDISVSSCDRLIRLITDLLDISKIEAGALELHLSDNEPKTLIDSAIDGVKSMAHEAGVELKKEVVVSKKLRGDSDRIVQVLTNLVSNAIKFSPANSHVWIKAKPMSEERIRFIVTDQGPGISKDDLNKLFGKFQQLSNASTIATKGSGLGLAISKAIVNQHSGEIGVESKEGEGTTFWFEVPCGLGQS